MKRIDHGKLWRIGFLHMGQSIPGALTSVALPALFRQNGMPLEMLWLFALPLIPTWLRWLVALLVDNFGSVRFGFRKSWILPCTLLGAGMYLVIAAVPPGVETIVIVVSLLVLKSTIMTAQDVAVDGLAAESFNDAERARGASIIVLLSFLGTVAAQGLVASVEPFGWQPVMTAAAVLLIVVALPTFVRPEPPPPDAALARRQSGQSASILEFLRRNETRLILPVLLVVGFSSNLMRAVLPVFLVDIGLTLADIGIGFGIAVAIGATLATTTVPAVSNRLGLTRAAYCFVAGYVPCLAVFYLLSTTSQPALALVTAVLTYVMYISTAMWMLVMQARMAWSSEHQAATDFSAQSSVANLGEWLGATAAGFLAAGLGWTWFFHAGWVFAALAGVAFALIVRPVDLAISSRHVAQAYPGPHRTDHSTQGP